MTQTGRAGRTVALPARRCRNCQQVFCGVDDMCLRCIGASSEDLLARALLASEEVG